MASEPKLPANWPTTWSLPVRSDYDWSAGRLDGLFTVSLGDEGSSSTSGRYPRSDHTTELKVIYTHLEQLQRWWLYEEVRRLRQELRDTECELELTRVALANAVPQQFLTTTFSSGAAPKGETAE